MSNAFFYWLALPAEWPREKFERFEKELKAIGGAVERVERFTSGGRENVFTIFSTPEYLGHQYSEKQEDGSTTPPRSELAVFTDVDLAWVSDATENTRIVDLGAMAGQRADRARGIKVTTQEEETRAWSNAESDIAAPRSSRISAFTGLLFGAAGAMLLWQAFGKRGAR